MCKPSASRCGRSSKRRSGVTPDCTRSIASHALAALSSCQEFDSPIERSRRRTTESRQTTSSVADLILFSITGRLLGGTPEQRKILKKNTLDGFYFVSFDLNGQRSLHRIDRYN